MDNDKADSDVIHNDNVISIASRHNKSPSESKDVCEMSGQEIVNEIGNINLFTNSVDVIPANWYKHVINSKGYADINAIIVLAHLVYWYRPRKNGTKRFSGERLELVYAQLEKRFNLNKYLASITNSV